MTSFWGRVGQVFRLSGQVPFGAFFSGANYAQKDVTPDTVLNLSTAWACQRLISGTVATLPLHIMRRGENGRRALAKEHPVSEVLRGKPNATQTPVEFMEGMVASLVGRGMGYALKDTLAGDLTGLRPWDYDRCIPMRRPSGALFYQVTFRDGKQSELGPDDVFVLKGFTDNREPDLGLSTLAYGRQTFGNAIAVEEAVGRQYAKGLKQSGFFYTDNPAARLDADKRAQFQAIIDQFAGSQNAGATMLLEGGFKWQSMGINPADFEMLATRSFNIEDVCRWYQVPPMMIGHTDKMTSWPGGQEGMRMDFRDFCLMPYLTRIEQAIDTRLLTSEDRRAGYYAKFSSEGLLRGNVDARSKLYSSALQNGWMTRDEVRELEEWDAISGGGGDLLTVQQNLTPLAMLQREAEARTMTNGGTPPAPTLPTPGV
jgi:HK97 family phage portal protein